MKGCRHSWPGSGTEFRIHDAAGDGGRAGQRKQGAGASGIGRFDHDFRQQGRLRVDGNAAAIKLKKIVENTRNAIAIEAMAAAQALDFLAPLKTSKRGSRPMRRFARCVATMEKDRVMYQDFARIAELIASGKVAEALR